MPERFVCTSLAKKALCKYSSFPFYTCDVACVAFLRVSVYGQIKSNQIKFIWSYKTSINKRAKKI